MKLFRHHNDNLELLIQKGEFVLDQSRRYNSTSDVKNQAQLYFYATTIEGAEQYKNEDFETKLRTHEVLDTNLLDLRVVENRALLTKTIEAFINSEEATKESMRIHVPTKFQDALVSRKTTPDDIINDIRVDGLTFWGQRCSDYQFGVILKAQLIELGYDGIIFQDGLFSEVALLEAIK